MIVAMNSFLKTLLASLATGLIAAAAFPAWHQHYLAWVCLVPLLVSIRKAKPLEAFWSFLLAGFVFHLMVINWIAANVFWAGGWALVGWAMLALYMALYWGALGALWVWIRDRSNWPIASFAFGFLWVSIEYLQATLLTGFGWTALAYSQVPNTWFIQLAALGGTGLVAWCLALVNVLAARTITESRWRLGRIATLAVVLVAAHGIGYGLHGESRYGLDPMRVGIFQSDFPQDMKWDPEYTEEMVQSAVKRSVYMVREQGADVVVWPEALAVRDPKRDYGIRTMVQDMAAVAPAHYFIGAVRDDEFTNEGYNSGYLVGPDGAFQGYYDKVHLAPFGEYIPLETMWPVLRTIVPAIGAVEAGVEPHVFRVDDRAFGPLICFEVLFGPMGDKLRRMDADFLVVITNLGWFGDSSVLPQELEIARVRAIENRMPVVHAANTGVSGVIDPYGRVEVVNHWFRPGTDQVMRARDDIEPYMVERQRMFGVFDLADAEDHPLPNGPQYFPFAAIALALVLALMTLVFGEPRKPLDDAIFAKGV